MIAPAERCIWCGQPCGLKGDETGPCASCGRHLGSRITGATTLAELLERLPPNGALRLSLVHIDETHDGALIECKPGPDAEIAHTPARWERT